MSTSSEDADRPGRHRQSLVSALYVRYVVVILVLMAVVGFIQYVSLNQSLTVAGQNSLALALSDALRHQGLRLQTPADFVKSRSVLLSSLSARGVNVALYDPALRLIGERRAFYDPARLVPLTPAIAQDIRQRPQTAPLASNQPTLLSQTNGQALLFASVGAQAHPAGYIELGYQMRILGPIIDSQALRFFVLSVAVLVLAAILLWPVVNAPLQPLRRLTRTAERIRAGAFRERLPVVGSQETVKVAQVINSALDQMASALEKEAAATRKMKEFVAAASHELRTPLTAIRGFSDVILRRLGVYAEELAMIEGLPEDTDDEQWVPPAASVLTASRLDDLRRALETISNETGRLERLVQDLLQLARLDEGWALRKEEADLAELVASLRPQLEVLAQGRTVKYDLNRAVGSFDRTLLGQVVYNLVMNAIQYTPAQGGEIVVSVGTTPDARARLTVADNGMGIASEQADRIFDRFYRAPGARDRNPGGTGLGLSIVATIVQAHGGTIRVDSKPGAGTTMIVDL